MTMVGFYLFPPFVEREVFLQTIVQPILEALNQSPLLIHGLTPTASTYLTALTAQATQRPSLIITHNEERAKQIKEDLHFFLNKANTYLYPAKDIIFYSADVRSATIVKQRFAIIEALLKEEQPVIVLSVEALFDKLTPKSIFSQYIKTIELGKEYNMQTLAKELILLGYESTDQVEGEGQFAIRGGILDVFPPNLSLAVRVEFWGDEVDSIRQMDVISQRSLEKIEGFTLLPMRELVYDKDTLQQAITGIREDYHKASKQHKLLHNEDALERLDNHILAPLEQLSLHGSISGVDRFFPYFHQGENLLDYLPSDTLLYFDEPNRISQKAEISMEEFMLSTKGRIEAGYMLPHQVNMFFTYPDLQQKWDKFTSLLFMNVTATPKDFKPKTLLNVPTREISLPPNDIPYLIDELNHYKATGKRAVLITSSKTKGERLLNALRDHDIEGVYIQHLADATANISVTAGHLSQGFEYAQHGIVLLSETEVFASAKKERKKKKNVVKLESFSQLTVGDYIVHDAHGIGIFSGIEDVVDNGITRAYIKLTYADGGNIYVATTQIDRIQKYVGKENTQASLSKLGTGAWEKAKERAKGRAKELAKELMALYAKRKEAIGHEYAPDSVWQKEFEEAFEYTETNDQLNAIEDVKRDMESDKIMDRLICGDVGFGKTEVAIRAAFKAVQDGKQVAFLVPTTILAQQHYSNFVQRMQNYPVTIELLSRFRTKKQQTESLQHLKSGRADILIGTHRLLSKDVVFKDLGLVIVDEEQRFGVAHKEKLKHLMVNVDVLTLTATPIPRTLHMSLAGIREISTLQDPPTQRKTIQTFVLEYNEEFIKNAISRELSRGGQVYFLHNRVQNIEKIADTVAQMAPEARVEFAHGQMSKVELENVMIAFINGEIDVLVCTTIVETGLDIPNVNTIIIQDADKMGLAQLYQLRGRVGRGDRIAYSYLMYRKDKVLDETASRRLQTIRDFTEFGSGFKVALKDLEIRGVGSLLGGEQSGHMVTIGYELYNRLLEQAIKEEAGEVVISDIETLIDIKVSAYIRDTFIQNQDQRMDMYKKIAHISDQKDFYDIQEEIEDRYGDIPKPTQTLLKIALLKGIANRLRVSSILQKNTDLVVTFLPDAPINFDKIQQALSAYPMLRFTNGVNPFLTYKGEKSITETDIETLREILSTF